MAERNGLLQSRLDKLARIRQRGLDPYPPRSGRTHTTAEAIALFESHEAQPSLGETHPRGPEITVAGRIVSSRAMGKATFAHILDGSGKLQLYLRVDRLGEAQYAYYTDFDLGDIIEVTGNLFRTRTGEVTLEASRIALLAKALRPLPEKWHGLTDVEKRYRQRYLDLVSNEEVKETFRIRSRVVAAVRRFMDSRGFLEVETPVLQPQAGGAAARPFKTYHNALDRELYLRIALELHLKRLLVGGFDKVYEIGRVFRNEGIDAEHNPEFTLMESYEAYTDYHGVARLVEELVAYAAQEVLGTTKVSYKEFEIDLAPPWRRLTVYEALLEYAGIDFEQYRDEASLRALFKERGLETPSHLGWGKLIDELIAIYVEPKLIQPTFLMDYPVELSPLAKRKPGSPNLVERFEPFIAGGEIGNAYTELNDPIDQRARLQEQLRLRAAGDEEAELLDEDFLTALEHGMPPAGGLGLGIDRLVMLLSGQRSIREVILFPQLRTKD